MVTDVVPFQKARLRGISRMPDADVEEEEEELGAGRLRVWVEGRSTAMLKSRDGRLR